MSELQKVVETRVIQVYFNGEAINLQTNSEKWSEVAQLVQSHERGFDLKGKKAVLGSTKGILQLPDALIPSGNQSIFLVQDKMKSGAEKPFEDMPYVDLRRAAKAKGIEGLGSNPTRAALIKALGNATGTTQLKGVSKAVKEKKENIIKEVKKVTKETAPDLQERVEALEKTLGTAIIGFGEVLDALRGGAKIVKEDKDSIVKGTKSIANTTSSSSLNLTESNKVKSTEELAEEFRNMKLN